MEVLTSDDRVELLLIAQRIGTSLTAVTDIRSNIIRTVEILQLNFCNCSDDIKRLLSDFNTLSLMLEATLDRINNINIQIQKGLSKNESNYQSEE